MLKIRKENYWELAVFLTDYHSGQTSRGYRLLCKLQVSNMSSGLAEELRNTEMYGYLVEHYGSKV